MRRYLFLLLCLCVLGIARAQTTYTYRYWFDGIPDSQQTGTMSGNLFEMEVPTDGLDDWFHTLHFQVCDADGDWSSPISRTFIIVPDEVRPDRTIAGQPFRYWFDGNIASQQTGTMTGNLFEMEVPTDGLDDWFHTLHFQVCDADGDWSSPISRTFIIVPDEVHPDRTIAGQPYRYWFDGNVASQQTGTMTGNLFDVEMPTDGLDDWFHTLHFQVCDADGDWSSPISRAFVIAPPMTGDDDVTGCPYHYWFDEDTIMVDGTMPGNILELDVPVGKLEDGEHVLYFQVQNREGYWSAIVSGEFSILNNILIIRAGKGGMVAYGTNSVRDGEGRFSLDKSSEVELTLSPDVCYRVGNVKANDVDMSTKLENDTTVDWGRESLRLMIDGQTIVDVTFTGHEERFTINGLDYLVNGPEAEHATLTGSTENIVVADVPEAVSYRDSTWTIGTVNSGVFAERPHLAAVVWRTPITLTQAVSKDLLNPNLLLYTTDTKSEQSVVTNIVDLNTLTAERITLSDAKEYGDFYCPIAFTAKDISYTHDYTQQTLSGKCQGWESIVLPFDVAEFRHETQGEIFPFVSLLEEGIADADGLIQEKIMDGYKPFWLYRFTQEGQFVEAEAIRANEPYILSMPNEPELWDIYKLNGRVTFRAANAMVQPTMEAAGVEAAERTFRPNFRHETETHGLYLLNVGDAYDEHPEGSVFATERPERRAHPFEACFEVHGTEPVKGYLDIFGNEETGIRTTGISGTAGSSFTYDLAGRKTSPTRKGIYIINGKLKVIK